MTTKTPVEIVGPDAFAAHVSLADGTTLEIHVGVTKVERIEGVRNPDGTPRYDFKAGIVGARVVRHAADRVEGAVANG